MEDEGRLWRFSVVQRPFIGVGAGNRP